MTTETRTALVERLRENCWKRQPGESGTNCGFCDQCVAAAALDASPPSLPTRCTDCLDTAMPCQLGHSGRVVSLPTAREAFEAGFRVAQDQTTRFGEWLGGTIDEEYTAWLSEIGARQPQPTAPEVLDMVEREISNSLYTNTKNGNREAMFNVVKRVRAALSSQEPPT